MGEGGVVLRSLGSGGMCSRSAAWNWLILWSSLEEPHAQRSRIFLVRVVPCFVLQCHVSGSWLMVFVNSLFVLVSRRFVTVSVVECVVGVFILFLIL